MELNEAQEIIADKLDFLTREAVLTVIKVYHDTILGKFKVEERDSMLRWHQAAMNACDELAKTISQSKAVVDELRRRREVRRANGHPKSLDNGL